jgi:hypothetical protein
MIQKDQIIYEIQRTSEIECVSNLPIKIPELGLPKHDTLKNSARMERTHSLQLPSLKNKELRSNTPEQTASACRLNGPSHH